MTTFIIVSDTTIFPISRMYMREHRQGTVSWWLDATMATRYATYGDAKRTAELRLPPDRRYKIIRVNTVTKAT